jgi:hypothetical protein
LGLEQRGHDLGVEHGPARPHLVDGLQQPVGVTEPLLEQVGDTGGAVLEELEGVLRVVVLREDHDARAGVVAAHPTRELDALGGEGGGHPDVEDDHVGRVAGEQLEEAARVTCGAEDLEPVDGVEDGAGTLTHEVVVLGDQQGGHTRCSRFRSGAHPR